PTLFRSARRGDFSLPTQQPKTRAETGAARLNTGLGHGGWALPRAILATIALPKAGPGSIIDGRMIPRNKEGEARGQPRYRYCHRVQVRLPRPRTAGFEAPQGIVSRSRRGNFSGEERAGMDAGVPPQGSGHLP